MREDLAPFGEGLVGAEHDGFAGIVAPGHDLEEQISVTTVVREIADLVDTEEVRNV
jgi:hypothetical protein